MLTLRKRDYPKMPVATNERWLVRFKTPSRTQSAELRALRNCAYAQTRAHLYTLSTVVRHDGTIAAQTSIPTWK